MQHSLTDGGTGNAQKDPGAVAEISPGATTSDPIFIQHQPDALFPADLYADLLLKEQLILRLQQDPEAESHSNLVKDSVTGSARHRNSRYERNL